MLIGALPFSSTMELSISRTVLVRGRQRREDIAVAFFRKVVRGEPRLLLCKPILDAYLSICHRPSGYLHT